MSQRKFELVTDSGCDLPAAYYTRHGIPCVRLGFTMDNVVYEGEGGESLSPKTFYAKLREGSMPTTYQVTVEMAKRALETALEKGRDVLAIVFSSGLSGTADSFFVAARELSKRYPKRKIFVVDSLCASMGEGLLLDYVRRKADEGGEIEEVYRFAEDLKLKICHHFTVDSLFHLKRGGRVSSASAFIGTILKIKPVMHVNDEGRLIVLGKSMGRKKALCALLERFFDSYDGEENGPVFISHGDCIKDVEFIKERILSRYPKTKITVHYIGAVIGSHAGAGTLAVFNKGKAR